MFEYPTAYKFKDGSTCNTCSKEIASKSYASGFSTNVGTIQEWIDQLKEMTTTNEVKYWWSEVNTILWTKEENSKIIKAYVNRIAYLAGKEWLGDAKPFPKKLAGMEKIYGTKI